MSDVIVSQINNIYVKVTCEDSIAQELSDFFTFSSPGAQFSPAFKKRHWDGKIRLFSIKTKLIYAGLIKYIDEFCELNNYKFVYEWPEVYPVDTKNLSKALSLPLEPRDYQLIASSYALTKKRSVIISPTASGKSLIIYLIVRHLMSYKKQGILIVPTVSLVEQMFSDFKSYGWDAEKYCQKIYAGQSKEPSKFLIISTWQSVYDMPKSYFKDFDFVIGDEAHTFKAKSLTAIMTKLVNCDVRIGTTGTLDSSKVHKLVLEGLFGPVKKIVSTKELMDRGHLAELNIKCIVLKYPEESCKLVQKYSYQEEVDYIVRYKPRNDFISNLALSLNGNSLILFTFVEKHGKILFEQIKNSAKDRKVFFVFGGTEVEEREAVRSITEKENDAIIIASYGVFSTGINIRNLHNIIFSSPTKSKIRSLQSIGRGLRLGDDKKSATLYDIVDDLRFKTNDNFAIKHFEERIKIYSEEKFTFKIYNIQLTQKEN
jgi:superfamily II DNA or RNA helicase